MTTPAAGTIGQLEQALRAGAAGAHSDEAAVSLLIGHGAWLRRADFLRYTSMSQSITDPAVTYAFIDWDQLHPDQLAASASELNMLRLAMELAGRDSGQPLATLIAGLDTTNTGLVLRAVLHASRGAGALPQLVSPFDS
jgi:hypothetical protein